MKILAENYYSITLLRYLDQMSFFLNAELLIFAQLPIKKNR